MSESVQGQMVGCQSSAQLWSRITSLFATRSKARVMQYKLQLQTLKKGNLSMKDYLSKMKSYVDILAACGHPVSDEDHVLYILGGVGLEYDSVVVHVTSRIDALSSTDVGALLLSHEARVESYSANMDGSSSQITTSPTANVSEFSQPKGRDSQQHGSQFRGRGRGRSFRGGKRSWNSNSRRPVCQICGYSGHLAEQCYYRFDRDFIPPHRHQKSFPPPASQHHPSAAIAVARSDPVPDDWWFPDSGASHHVTNELANLTLGSEYSGGGKLHMGNGSGLPITHIGSSTFHPSSCSRTLSLSNLLHVPDITKNLISVSKFAQDNAVFFEFHPSFCVVKDLTTHAPLLRGVLHDGLYKFHLGPPTRTTSSASCFNNQISPASVSSNKEVQSQSSKVASSSLFR